MSDYVILICHRQIRHEFDLREKMFLKIREENEKEISTLKSIMQSLEARLSVALDDSDDGGVEMVEYKGELIALI